jgi:DNA repair protein RecO (recombination protein O)
MSKELAATAIVLKVSEVADTDRIYLLFTRELGKIRARAKGVRRVTSKMAGHLTTGALTDIRLHPSSGGWYLLTQAHREARNDPEDPLQFLAISGVISELLDVLIPDGAPNVTVFDTAAAALASGEVGLPSSCILAEFTMKLLVQLGYQPNLHMSAIDGAPLTADNLRWSSELSGVFNALPGMPVPPDSVSLSGTKAVVLLRQLAEPGWVSHRLRGSEELAQEVLPLLLGALERRCHRQLKSLSALVSLR